MVNVRHSTVSMWHFDVPLNIRFKTIRLEVNDAGDGKASDHADWVNAGFLAEKVDLKCP